MNTHFTFNVCRVLGNPSNVGYAALDNTTHFVFGIGGTLDVAVILDSFKVFVGTVSSKPSFNVCRNDFNCKESHLMQTSCGGYLNLIVAFPSFTKRVNTCSIFFFTYKYKKQTK